MLLRQSLEQVRAPHSEAVANLSLWDTYQRIHAGETPTWVTPAPRRNRAPGHVRRESATRALAIFVWTLIPALLAAGYVVATHC